MKEFLKQRREENIIKKAGSILIKNIRNYKSGVKKVLGKYKIKDY